MTKAAKVKRGGSELWVRAIVYLLFFLSGASALILEIVWTRQFVIVFGNSTYAISLVLAAYMAGLGIGALYFGRFADRHRDHLYIYAALVGGIIIWAILMPLFVRALLAVTPGIFARISNFALISAVRFVFSFAALFVPCFLMGGTLPVLSRFVVRARAMVGRRVSLLYGLNTLGAAAGCFAAGFFLIETIGQSGTNWVAVLTSLFVLAAVLVLRAFAGASAVSAEEGGSAPARDEAGIAEEGSLGVPEAGLARLLLATAFISGFATMCVEVLWLRFLVFVVPNNQYSFTAILGVLLIGLALGSVLYRLLLAGRKGLVTWLGAIEVAIGVAIVLALVAGTRVASDASMRLYVTGLFKRGSVLTFKGGALGLSAVTVFLPTVLIGLVFPLVCAVYTASVEKVGRSVAHVSAASTFGSIAGSLAPIVFVVPLFGIERGVIAVAVLSSALGIVILGFHLGAKRVGAIAAAGVVTAVFYVAVVAGTGGEKMTWKVFLSHPEHSRANHKIIFYREGRTATVLVIENTQTGLPEVYIGGVEEVPTTYMGRLFFKVFGSIGPLVSQRSDEVLILCLGGGVTAGTAKQFDQVQRVECVDLVADMVGACRVLSDINLNLVEDPKFSVVIEDARNYLVLGRKKFPVVVCDSTHPKSPDSWALYTTEFYRMVRERLAEGGVFAQWAPIHSISMPEYKTLVRTFQSVFPHTSVWMVTGVDETGGPWASTVLLATDGPLSIDVASLEERLTAPHVQKDLEYWDLDTPAGFLSTFLCGEETLAKWIGDGPVNTDDLPYTQYHTRITATDECRWDLFIEPLESVEPYLRGTGDADETARLSAELAKRLAAKKLVMEGRVVEAAARAGGGRMTQMKENLALGRRYLVDLAALSEGDAAGLDRVAQRLSMLSGFDPASRPEIDKALVDVCRKIIEVDPDNSAAHVNLGVALASLGQIKEAAASFDRAIMLDPENAAAYANLATLADQVGRPDEAARLFRKAASIDPGDGNVLHGLGMVLVKVGARDEALRNLRAAVAISPENAEYRHSLGVALADGGDIDEAIAEFRQAVDMDQQNAAYRLSLGMALGSKGDTNGALDCFDQVIKQEPYNAQAHTQRGLALLQKGDSAGAKAAMRRALVISPGEDLARGLLASLLRDEGKYAEAIDILREGMKISPTPGQAHLLAMLLATAPDDALRNGAEAVMLAEEVNRLSGGMSSEALDVLAAAYAETGQFDRALLTAQQALLRAESEGNREMAALLKGRIELYKQSKPLRQ